MSAKDFDVGDLVWAKMKGFPAWPGKIIDPPVDAKSPKQKKPQHYVYFFGTNNHAWILDENIVPHDDRMVQSANRKKSSAYQSAIEAIVNHSKNAYKPKSVAAKIFKVKEPIAGKESSQNKTPKPKKGPSHYEAPNQSKTPNSVNDVPKKSSRELKKCIVIKKSDVPVQRKTAKKQPLIYTDGAECPVSYLKTEAAENDFADLVASVPLNKEYSHTNVILPRDSCYHRLHGIVSTPEYIEQLPTPVLGVSDISKSLKKEESTCCSKTIGFLGLGNMGQCIVENLLKSGHRVTVWNRTPKKMDIFLNAGASRGQTPADVVQASDITFCCVSDSDAVKCLVFGNCGVLKGLESCPNSNKGYVEMTSIDPETSKAVGDEITLKGGRYLEALIAGSKENAIEGTLSILVAGDQTLFAECETCFRAIGKDAYYIISPHIGTGAKMNLILSMLHGSLYAAMAESMALVQCCELSPCDFLETFKLGPLNCQAMLDMAHAILKDSYLINTPLKHIQKDINLALTLSASADQPLLVAAAAKEMYKTY